METINITENAYKSTFIVDSNQILSDSNYFHQAASWRQLHYDT